MIEKIGIRNIYGRRSIVYKIFLKQSSVFMRADETLHENDSRYIAIVDANKFYKEWTGETTESCVIGESEKKKYADAIDGFSRGITNPVPLAEAGYYNGISFTNGITRTKWLILNGALCFPVECSERSAKRFQSISYDNIKPESVATLLLQEGSRP
jgi:hypothetical protein